jgi:protoporphyrinogen oxidase
MRGRVVGALGAMDQGTALVIGGGPAGLTCALELLRRTNIKPIVFEASDGVGGISRTFQHCGNRIDIGGHRFFSKSDRVMQWWTGILPIQELPDSTEPLQITYQNSSRWIEVASDGPDPAATDDVMLVRPRRSRILFRRQLFDYPVSLTLDTLMKLGPVRVAKIGMSYLGAKLSPISPENTLEEFFINRFGRELYQTFFRDYTEKVWGTPCSNISASWGAQRVKGLSLIKTLAHAWSRLAGRPSNSNVETSLIERFLYPKRGPGQMWEKVAALVTAQGGEIRLGHRVTGIDIENGKATRVRVLADGHERTFAGEYVASTMPIRDLIRGLEPAAPTSVQQVSEGLIYRDFLTVGLLLKKLLLGGECTGRELSNRMPDNWIYVQEPDVRVGRLQFFNNWSPYMVADPDTVWIGLEYFCNENDELWRMDDAALARLGATELERIGVIRQADVISSTVVRMPKAYPAYFGTFDRFGEVRAFLDGIPNLIPLGRNGMHRYNNQDHSMLTAMVAVDNILAGRTDKTNIWSVNTEVDYHEEK